VKRIVSELAFGDVASVAVAADIENIMNAKTGTTFKERQLFIGLPSSSLLRHTMIGEKETSSTQIDAARSFARCTGRATRRGTNQVFLPGGMPLRSR
jgi:hypothetical protein